MLIKQNSYGTPEMRFQFAEFELDVERRELRQRRKSVPTEPQVFDLLVYLVRHRERVVTKDEMIEAVWGGRIVSESTLTSRINAARKAVGDSGQEQHFIRTFPRKGIRFVGDVECVESPGHIDPVTSRPTIAVMPFNNLSGEANQDYFVDGMVAEIITGLSRIKWLFVISYNSTFAYKGKQVDVKLIGRELGVRYVLEGSVRKSGKHIRVTGQLIEAETGIAVWADRYEGTLKEIFALQDAMTMNVIGAVEPTLRRVEVERAKRKRPENLDAYDLYLRALPFAAAAMPDDAKKALVLLEEALAIEPDYPAAHGIMAWCYEQLYLRGGLLAETRSAALQHAQMAIKTGSDDAMALAMGGFVVGVVEHNYETALIALDEAISLSPSSAIAFGFSSIIRAWKGDYEVAIEHAKSGIKLSPLDPLIFLPYVGLAYAHYFAGDYANAASAASRAAFANALFSVPCYLNAAALHRLGRDEEASIAARTLLTLQPSFTVSGLISGNITSPERMELLASALRQLGLPN